MDVTMPDGTLVQGVPDGVTQSQLMARYQKYQQPSLYTNIGNDVSNAYNEFNSDVGRNAGQGVGHGLAAGLEGTADIVKGAGNVVGTIAKNDSVQQAARSAFPGYDLAQRAVPYIKNAAESGAQGIADAIDSPATDNAAIGAGQLVNTIAAPVRKFAQENPESAKVAMSVPTILGGVYGAEGLAKGVGTAREAITDLTQPAADSFAASKAANASAKFAKSQAPLISSDALHTNAALGMNDVNNASKDVYGKIYSNADVMAKNDSIAAPEVKANISNLINKISNNGKLDTSSPFTRTLDEIHNQFDPQTGEISLSDLTNAKKATAKLYSDRELSAGEAEIYHVLNNSLDSAIAKGAAQNPYWGKEMNFANEAFQDHVLNIRDNKTLGLTSDDLAAINNSKATAEGAGFPPSVMQKVRNLSNITDQTQLESTLKILPESLHDAFLQAVKNNSANSPGVIKTATSFLTKNPVKVAKSLWSYATQASGGLSPDEINYAKRLVPHSDVMQSWSDLSDKNLADFQAHQGNVSKGLQQQADSAAEMQPMRYGARPAKPMLALPAPKSTGIFDAQGRGAFMTPADREILGQQAPRTQRSTPFGETMGNEPMNNYRAPNRGTNAEYDDTIENEAKQTLGNLSRKRGGAVLTPTQIREMNKKNGKTKRGRVA